MSNKWEKLSVLANVATALASIAMMGCAIVSVWFLFTQTPLYMGSRPKLSFHTEMYNSPWCANEGPKYNKSTTCTEVTLTNSSSNPAKDIYVAMVPIENVPLTIECRLPYEELSLKGLYDERIIRIATVPANSAEVIRFIQDVERYPQDFRMQPAEEPLSREESELAWASGNIFRYFTEITKVYSELGDVVELQHLNKEELVYQPDDRRSEAGLERREKLRRKRAAGESIEDDLKRFPQAYCLSPGRYRRSQAIPPTTSDKAFWVFDKTLRHPLY